MLQKQRVTFSQPKLVTTVTHSLKIYHMEERYKISIPIAGQGGYGKIDKATDTALERDVAIKTLDPIFRGIEQTDIERFKREAKILAAVSHPNIPAIYDVIFNPDQTEFKLIYAWIEGQTLNRHLMEAGTLSLEDVRRYFGNICSALSHAHSKGIIHRDIKPSNIIITKNLESCYIVDFGISLTSKDIERITDGSNAVGTPGYMSPEQENNEELNGSADVYSLAIVLYECLSGNRPTIGEYRPLNSINEAIPSTVDILIRECLVSKEKRIKTVDDFHTRLNQALRPSANIGTTFSKGGLSDVVASLQGLNHITFNNLPVGQRILLMTRFKSLIATDDFKIRNPTASFIEALLRICGRLDENDFRPIVSHALVYGFEMQYGERWIGNPAIRLELATLAASAEPKQHKILSEETLKYLTGKNLTEKEPWFLVDMRNFLQNLLANELCEEDIAIMLGEKLGEVLIENYNH